MNFLPLLYVSVFAVITFQQKDANDTSNCRREGGRQIAGTANRCEREERTGAYFSILPSQFSIASAASSRATFSMEMTLLPSSRRMTRTPWAARP